LARQRFRCLHFGTLALHAYRRLQVYFLGVHRVNQAQKRSIAIQNCQFVTSDGRLLRKLRQNHRAAFRDKAISLIEAVKL